MGNRKGIAKPLSSEYLDAIIEHSFDGIYITDGQANTIKVNRSYLTITGLKKSEVIGYNMRELVRNKTISASGTLMALEQKRPVTIQQEFKTGKRALITSSPITNGKNEVVLVITNVRDITELYRLKEEGTQLRQEEQKLRKELQHMQMNSQEQCSLIAEDAKTSDIISLLNRVSPLDTTVILLGETGVGKEVFAKYIYQNSTRKDKPFIKVNCGAIPASLVESELFGYEKGAFTGADRNGKMGLFEVANNGTIFLDEVGELPLDMQVKLLRVLQEQEFERIGGRKPVKVNVRVLAATNRNLEEMVSQKTFREDLYYRLMIFPIHIPPLRERTEDIIPLARLFLSHLNKKYDFKKYFAPISITMMQDYNWPGNIRELRNIVERAVIISNGDEITPDALHLYPVEERPKASPHILMPVGDLKSAMEALELEYINRAYEMYGNVREAAASLGMTPSTFVRKRQRFSEETQQSADKE
ncbi:MAG: sigma 54-interacting transcriptional regulator [Lachnospiraceae bacterium]|nr:sigma 54-interacting transcriptional regulator [Lachnospiraceae bacterium]